MSNITIPGFTAGASLEGAEKGVGYRIDWFGKVKSDSIIPQRIKLVDVHCECDTWTDICVCDNGRVLHATLGEL